jgi:hypothetical protein
MKKLLVNLRYAEPQPGAINSVPYENKKNLKTETIVDDEDYERLKKYKWHDSNGYLRGMIIFNNKAYHVLIQRFIMLGDKSFQDGRKSNYVIDHINHNTYDNRKENLRMVTHAENLRNRRKLIIPDGFCDLQKATEMLGYKTKDNIYYLIKKGGLKKYKILGTPIFKIEEIKKIMTPEL